MKKEDSMPRLKSGDKAPAFSLLDQNGKKVGLKDFQGSKLLLYFYPKAGTSGWTNQAGGVRDAREELKSLKTAAVGISPDQPDQLKKFDEKYGLGFPLLSDPDHKTAEAYGAWGEKTMYGKKVWGIIRSSFLIDEKGRVDQVWYKVSPADTVPKVLETLVKK